MTEPWYGKMMDCDRCRYLERREKRRWRIEQVLIVVAVPLGVLAILFSPRLF